MDTEVCGAIRWMPVEDVILQGSIARKPTKAGDIWSFGMTMFVSSKPLNRINYLSWGDRNYGLATYHIMAYQQNV